jgi:glycosyltransferase involved in cell wall biosynthesis
MIVAVVTCSPLNDYPRARSLRAAVKVYPGVRAIIVRNRHTGWLRYPETLLRLCKTRLIDRPDAYLVTFRGYETLLFMRLTMVRKPIIFDELINFTEWMIEQGRLKEGSLPFRLFRHWNAWVVSRCRFILADTDAHAQYSATLNMLSVDRYKILPVSIEEDIFKPPDTRPTVKGPFTVLYYGHMVALHGLEYVLRAAVLLKDRPDIQFRLAGGKKHSQVTRDCEKAITAGANLTHESWLPFNDLPKAINEAGIVLGGPFGDTLQAGLVVTGKTYQALACAAPVLIGRNQVNEGFIDKENCLVVPQADAQALADAIRWAADHPKQLERIGRAGRQLYETNFSEAMFNKIIRQTLQEL